MHQTHKHVNRSSASIALSGTTAETGERNNEYEYTVANELACLWLASVRLRLAGHQTVIFLLDEGSLVNV